MEILITGVTGRVGRNLSKILIDNGHSVRGLVLENDNNIELVREIGVKCYKGNLNNPESLVEAVIKVNAIYHLGGLMSWGNDKDNPLLFDDNLKGTFNLLNAITANSVKLDKFIFASSDEVYPSLLAKKLPIKETNPTTPYSFYGLTKLACEQMVLYFQRANNIPATIARFALITEPQEVTYKSGWLGRFLFFEPMFNIINSIPNANLIEMKRCKDKGFCCGAGGGHMWLEESNNQKINHVRCKESIETGAETVAVSCPFCLQMFSEAIQSNKPSTNFEAKDLLEIIDENIDRLGAALLKELWQDDSGAFGRQTLKKWKNFADWMQNKELLPKSVKPEDAFTDKYSLKE